MGNVLQEYEALLIQAKELFLEENSLLKNNKVKEHTALLERKKDLLKALEGGVETLKLLRESKAQNDQTQLRTLQDKIMQLLLLDRENEQLLLKQQVGSFRQTGHPKVTSITLEKLYKQL